MKDDTGRAAPDRLDELMAAAARQCVLADEPFVGRVFARAEGAEEPEAARVELDAHLDACAYCRALLHEHTAAREEPVPAWVTRPRPDTVSPWQEPTPNPPMADLRASVWAARKRWAPLVSATALAIAVVIGTSSLSAPTAPRVGVFEGQVAERMDGAAAEAARETTRPRYAITGVLSVGAVREDEAAKDESVHAFTVDAAERLVPLEARFVLRRDAWIGVHIKAPVASLFPDPSLPTRLVLCTSRVPAAELASKTLAEVNAGRDARCVARDLEVLR